MVRYIRAANYDYYPFLDTKEFVKLLWPIRTEVKRLGLKYEYYDNPDPDDLVVKIGTKVMLYGFMIPTVIF